MTDDVEIRIFCDNFAKAMADLYGFQENIIIYQEKLAEELYQRLKEWFKDLD